MAEEIKEKAAEAVKDVKSEASNIFRDVREEAAEVAQEAKAAIRGEELATANTVGGAGYREADDPKKNGKAIASLVLGIISLVCALFGFGAFLGIILAIIGVVLGSKARKINQTGLATAGFVCSLVGLILNGVAIVCVIACAGAAGIAGIISH